MFTLYLRLFDKFSAAFGAGDTNFAFALGHPHHLLALGTMKPLVSMPLCPARPLPAIPAAHRLSQAEKAVILQPAAVGVSGEHPKDAQQQKEPSQPLQPMPMQQAGKDGAENGQHQQGQI